MPQLLLDFKYGDLLGNVRCEKVSLYGNSQDDGLFMDALTLVVVGKDFPKVSCELSFGAYAPSLFLGDFLSLGNDQILVVGQSGGSGDYTVLGLYELKEGKLNLRCCERDISDLLLFNTQLVNDEQAYVLSQQTQMVFLVEVDEEGAKPDVSAPNAIYPIKQPYQEQVSFLVQQRIIGSTNSQTLGLIQSVLRFMDEGNLVIQNQYLLEAGYEK